MKKKHTFAECVAWPRGNLNTSCYRNMASEFLPQSTIHSSELVVHFDPCTGATAKTQSLYLSNRQKPDCLLICFVKGGDRNPFHHLKPSLV